MGRRKLSEVLREGLLQPWHEHSHKHTAATCGIVWCRRPSAMGKQFDCVEVRRGNECHEIEIDYWRIGPRPGAQVWLFITASGRWCLLPVATERVARIDEELVAVIRGRQSLDQGHPATCPEPVTGEIVAIERGPGRVVTDFTPSSFKMGLYGEKPRLLWFRTGSRLLVPVLVRKWYSNQRLGTRWEALGGWEQMGSLWVLVVKQLL